MRRPLDPSALERMRRIVAEGLGISVEPTDLESALADRLDRTGDDLATYLDRRLTSPDARRAELRVLASRLTVGESYFFRQGAHFEALFGEVLPGLLEPPDRRVRILSAGCSSGEEAHTLAILLLERLPEAAARVSIAGIDVDPEAISRARVGPYCAWALRQADPERIARWFVRRGRSYALAEEVRQLATFDERNLLEDDPSFWQPGAFDVVFCRNVVMYFSTAGARSVVARIARSLVPGGALFLGDAETLRGLSADFHLRSSGDAFYYRRRDGEPATPPPARIAPPIALPVADETWVESIRQAAERIAVLAAVAGPASRAALAPAPDLSPALEAFREERYSEALEHLANLPRSADGDADARLLRAAVLTNRGPVDEARRTLESLLAEDDLVPGAHYLMALCREHEGALDGAAGHDRRAIHLDPRFAMPHLHLGRLLRRAGEPDGARRSLARALELLPAEDPARILLFGGGFSREVLTAICRRELDGLGGDPS